jgi:hypothetical protein
LIIKGNKVNIKSILLKEIENCVGEYLDPSYEKDYQFYCDMAKGVCVQDDSFDSESFDNHANANLNHPETKLLSPIIEQTSKVNLNN